MTREQVINGLESVYRCVSPVTHTCEECPYQDNHVECKRRVLRDALALLKEQEAVKPICEQVNGTMRLRCGACGITITRFDKYCRDCGRKIGWQG